MKLKLTRLSSIISINGQDTKLDLIEFEESQFEFFKSNLFQITFTRFECSHFPFQFDVVVNSNQFHKMLNAKKALEYIKTFLKVKHSLEEYNLWLCFEIVLDVQNKTSELDSFWQDDVQFENIDNKAIAEYVNKMLI